MRKNNFEKKYFYGDTAAAQNKIRGIENYENEIREIRERYEKEKDREWYEKRKQYQMNKIKKIFEYTQKVYGTNGLNRKLSRMSKDDYEKYKAMEYVRKENLNGHECYNGINGEKLWINKEQWKIRMQQKDNRD